MFKIKAKNYSQHTGKMQGIRSINSNPLSNPFCIHMSKKENSICSKCYSRDMLLSGFRKSCIQPWEDMGKLLSEDLLDISEIKPCPNTKYIRFSSAGELINLTHFENFIQIAKVNNQSVCTLFTKRKDILRQLKQEIPQNMIVVYSNPYLDRPLYEKDIPEKANKIFNVFTREYANEHGISINCGSKKCKECMVCYSQNNINVINELIK